MTRDEFVKSKWFRQNAFSKTEMILHPLSSMLIAYILMNCFFTSSIGFYIMNIYIAILLKYLFYRIVALVYGLNFMTGNDEFMMYDFPINPLNIPVFLIVDKIGEDPEESLKRLLKVTGEGGFKRRNGIKHRKICGKYFFELLTKDDL
jgi:hypothetical protein